MVCAAATIPWLRTALQTYVQISPRTSHVTCNLGRYGNIRQQFSQAAIAVGTAVGTVVVVVVDVNVAGRNLRGV